MTLRSAPDREPHLAPRDRLGPEVPFAAYEAGLGSAAGLLAAAVEDRELAAQLVALPAFERQEAALHDPRFHRQTLVRLLSLRAESELFDPAGDPRATAELGAAIAAALPRDAGGKARRSAALAYWLLGKALLKASQWSLADQNFHRMLSLTPRRGPSEERALATAGRAQLCADTGDVEAAIGHFLLAASLFGKLEGSAPAAACQAELGLLLLASGDLVNAEIALNAAVALLDPGFAPSLAARLHLALAEVEAVLGDLATAAEELQRARGLYPLTAAWAEGSERIQRRWLEARVAAAAGAGGAAEALIEPLRCELLARGSLAEAARCTFEQVLLRIEDRRCAEVEALTGALANAFPGAGDRWAAEMAALARQAAENPEGVYRPCVELLRRLPRVAFFCLGRRPLLTPARLFADRLLRRRSEADDPIGAVDGL
jgi:hypothetical protein